jgi:CRP-like cAMP-binding protein
VVGALALFARDARGFECSATRDSVALALRADEVFEVFEDHFEMLHAVLRALARESIDTRLGLPGAGFATEVRVDVAAPVRPLDLVERLMWLRQVFARNSPRLDAVAEIARTCEEVRYPKGTPLWRIGDRSDRMLTVISGAIAAETATGARFRFGPLDIAGSLDMVAAVPRWYDTVVEDDMVALALDAELVIDLWEDNPDLSFAFLQILASTLLSLRERLYADPTPHAQTASP